jgi:hypothetical protein
MTSAAMSGTSEASMDRENLLALAKALEEI